MASPANFSRSTRNSPTSSTASSTSSKIRRLSPITPSSTCAFSTPNSPFANCRRSAAAGSWTRSPWPVGSIPGAPRRSTRCASAMGSISRAATSMARCSTLVSSRKSMPNCAAAVRPRSPCRRRASRAARKPTISCARARPRSPPRLSAQEAAAHAAFISALKAPLWDQYAPPAQENGAPPSSAA